MSEPQPPRGAETNAEHKPASAGLESLVAVGARLAQLREAKGWSVADVSARLKVAAPKLRALEAGDISQMPGSTFAVGVVRSYAKMLGVDPEPFAQALRREKGVPEVDLSMPASSGTDLPRGRVSIPLGAPTHRRSWLWGVLAVVVAVIAAAMWHSGGDSANWLAKFKSNAGMSGSASQPASGADSAAASDSAAIAVGGSTVTGDVASSAAASEAGASPVAATAPAEPAQPASVAPAVPARAMTPPAETSSADGASVVAAAGQSVLGITVKSDCWVSVRDKSGKELVSTLVKAGETRQIAGETPFRVTIGNRAGLDSVTFDGKTVDPAKYSAGRGNVARFALP
ncbi:helix-turn-helix domain-containing protein [Burkholderia plantarii]|uniref:helix-turn-helix domain-containing protein n=1 Tax=Burkholderia plantarii TaxID=41899 RepID=UPI0018DEACA5|nr:RodZ domain-containing protein [Burkholderia plantarii]MBI0328265.1 helix-turn-helix domain-containing protein [Burkholderia plantarii]